MVVQLVTNTKDPHLHAHSLVGKQCDKGICISELPPKDNSIRYSSLLVMLNYAYICMYADMTHILTYKHTHTVIYFYSVITPKLQVCVKDVSYSFSFNSHKIQEMKTVKNHDKKSNLRALTPRMTNDCVYHAVLFDYG